MITKSKASYLGSVRRYRERNREKKKKKCIFLECMENNVMYSRYSIHKNQNKVVAHLAGKKKTKDSYHDAIGIHLKVCSLDSWVVYWICNRVIVSTKIKTKQWHVHLVRKRRKKILAPMRSPEIMFIGWLS